MLHTTAFDTKQSLSTVAILVLALLSAVAPLATDMYLPGFPVMTADLATDAAAVQMTLTSFLLGLAVGQLVIGPLSDRFGRRRPLLIGTAIAIVSGFLCALAPNIETLIALRTLQGIGGAAGVVLARAIVADRTANAVAAARLFQIMMVIGGLGPALAPIIGTGIVEVAGWRGVFVVIALLSALSFAGSARFLSESLPVEQRTTGGFAALGRGIATVAGNATYVGYGLVIGFSFMVLFAYISASPFVYQGILGLSSVAYSIAFGANAVGIAIVSGISAKLVSGIKPQRLAGAGLCIMAAGVAATLISVWTGAGAWFVIPGIFVTVSSLGLVFGNASALAIAAAPRNAGTASALIGAVQFLFGAIASPLVGIAGKDSALPMALVMVAAATLAIASFIVASSRRPASNP